MLTTVDRAALAAYCVNYARWQKAETEIERLGPVVKSPKSGFPIQNPYVAIANTALDLMRKFLIEFGMTPASRSRLHIDPPGQPQDRFAAFMSGLGEMHEDDSENEGEQKPN
jgi:P27 family predicted phage terminase small subunit